MNKFILSTVALATLSGAMAATPNPNRPAGDRDDSVVLNQRITPLNGGTVVYITQNGVADIELPSSVPSTDGFFRTEHTPAGHYSFFFNSNPNLSMAAPEALRLLNEARNPSQYYTLTLNGRTNYVVDRDGNGIADQQTYDSRFVSGKNLGHIADDLLPIIQIDCGYLHDVRFSCIQSVIDQPRADDTPPASDPDVITHSFSSSGSYLSGGEYRYTGVLNEIVNGGQEVGVATCTFTLPETSGDVVIHRINARAYSGCSFFDTEYSQAPIPVTFTSVNTN